MPIQNERLNDLIAQKERSPFFRTLSSDLVMVCNSAGLTDKQKIAENLTELWLPLALELATATQGLNRTLIPGILGGQGMGKSTLCIILKFILGSLGLSVGTLSLDDLYLTYIERQELKLQDPRLTWRGPPGTHDIGLGMEVIEQCLQSGAQSNLQNNPNINSNTNTKISIPRFDKSACDGSGDRTTPEAIFKPDILFFEGWFVGAQPIAEKYFDNPPAPIITAEDKQFALDSNQRLKSYLPLWDKLDLLIVLYPEDYRLSKQWRKDAEHKMIARGLPGMSDDEIDRFVEYFWKSLHPELFIKPLTSSADWVVEIKRDRLSFRAV